MKTKTKIIFSITTVAELLLLIALSIWLAFSVGFSKPHDPIPPRPTAFNTYAVSFDEAKQCFNGLPLPDKEFLKTQCAGFSFQVTFHNRIERKNLNDQKPKSLIMFSKANTAYSIDSSPYALDGEIWETITINNILIELRKNEINDTILAAYSYDGYYFLLETNDYDFALAFLNAALADF